VPDIRRDIDQQKRPLVTQLEIMIAVGQSGPPAGTVSEAEKGTDSVRKITLFRKTRHFHGTMCGIKDRKLVVNNAEAATVRALFLRFIRCGSMTKLLMLSSESSK
jgi:hypothetical protein